MKNTILSWVLWLAVSLSAVWAQVPGIEFQAPRLRSQPTDTAATVKPLHRRFVLGLDTRNSFITETPVNIWGGNAGFAYGPQHTLMLGFYFLQPRAFDRLVQRARLLALLGNVSQYTGSRVYYFSLIYQYNIVNNRRFVVGFPVELGAGWASVSNRNIQTDLQTLLRQDWFVPGQVGLYTEWKATRWLGLSTQIGYRLTLARTDIRQNYNGLYYTYGTNIYPASWRWVGGLFSRKRSRA